MDTVGNSVEGVGQRDSPPNVPKYGAVILKRGRLCSGLLHSPRMENAMKKPRYWKPLQQANAMKPHSDEVIDITMTNYEIDREDAVEMLMDDLKNCTYWLNSLYQVERRELHDDDGKVVLIQLNIRRIDGAAIHDWRHLQTIKNELVGEDCEGIELYPAESRHVDTSNKYNLWCSPDPTFRFPVGWQDRDVQNGDMKSKTAGLRQRPM